MQDAEHPEVWFQQRWDWMLRMLPSAPALFGVAPGIRSAARTHYSLLCMSSIKSVKSTSRLRSQKPFTS